MRKVLKIEQIRSLDAYTIEHEPVASIDLMERAAVACSDWLLDHFPAIHEVTIFCGPGNNGGDGLAIARLLHTANWSVQVIIPPEERFSDDFRKNLERLIPGPRLVIHKPGENEPLPPIEPTTLIVDAMFGNGLKHALSGIYAQWVEIINALPNLVIAVDIPSGLFSDAPSQGAIIKADFTLAFEVVKPAFLIPENQPFIGEWDILPIGLHQEYLNQLESHWFLLTEEDIGNMLHMRQKFDHKGVYGHALIIAGSYGKAGAAVLSTLSALRAGAGLVTAHVPGMIVDIIQSSVPEVMVDSDDQLYHFSGIDKTSTFSAIGIGPGIGLDEDTAKGFHTLLDSYRKPIVVDADGLNILSMNQGWLARLPENSILTPHFKEFERLFGASHNHFERLDMLQQLALRYKVIIVLKGAHTAIATPDGNVLFNTTGNPGMATAGTGDVLTGMITGLLAQHYSPIEATCIGVYLHGLAGDIAAAEVGYESMIATDLIDSIGAAFQELQI